jgi:uncharacterized protein (TIGR00251 family)
VSLIHYLRVVEEGVVVRIWVIPGASKTAIDGYDSWKKSLRFKTKEPALKDAANRSVLEFFASLTGRKTVLKSGAISKQKEVLVLGATLEELRKIFKEI